ncbi:MAG: DUF368 domain-containing protein [Ruminiclostridium sp.]|nr:DUF368 domain-containing protein [Ruminiclostridium sp.]
MLQYLLAVVYGIVFGVANIIPGVSGGTMLVVFGCYDKVCGALTLNLKEIKKNISFLIFFGIGAVIGIVGFAFVITFLFTNFPVQTNMFFMGLIIGSVPLIIRNATVKEKFKPICILPFVIGLAAVVGLALLENGSTNPYRYEMKDNGISTTITIYNDSNRTVNGWTIEFEDEAVQLDETTEGDAVAVYDYSTIDKIKGIFGVKLPANTPNTFTNKEGAVIEAGKSMTFIYHDVLKVDSGKTSLNVSYAMDVPFFLTMMVSLFVAAIAMIIPGVSGSFVMMTLGVYSTVIAAVKGFDFAIIIPCAIGVIAGLVLGARLITFLMKKWSLMVYSVILGLVAGSVYVIFPAGFGFNIATLTGFAALIVGGIIAVLVGKNTKVEAE